MRSISRGVGVSINTVTKLLVDAGEAWAAYHEGHVRNVKPSAPSVDETWNKRTWQTPRRHRKMLGACDLDCS